MTDKGKAPKGDKQPKRKQKMVRLSGLSEKLIAPALKQRSGYLRQLIAHWPHIMGAYANWAQPSDIKMGRDETDKTILILSVHSARGPEASARAQEFIELVNRFFGYALIGGIRIKQDLPPSFAQNKSEKKQRTAPAPTESTSADIADLAKQDTELSLALAALQKAITDK